jgi:hypothetical protein
MQIPACGLAGPLFFSLVLFLLLWERRAEHVAMYVHLFAAFIVATSVVLTFVAIWIDNAGRVGVNRHARLRQRASPRGRKV